MRSPLLENRSKLTWLVGNILFASILSLGLLHLLLLGLLRAGMAEPEVPLTPPILGRSFGNAISTGRGQIVPTTLLLAPPNVSAFRRARLRLLFLGLLHPFLLNSSATSGWVSSCWFEDFTLLRLDCFTLFLLGCFSSFWKGTAVVTFVNPRVPIELECLFLFLEPLFCTSKFWGVSGAPLLIYGTARIELFSHYLFVVHLIFIGSIWISHWHWCGYSSWFGFSSVGWCHSFWIKSI